MTRFLALFCASLLSFVSIASTSFAATGETLNFTLSADSGSNRIRGEFRRDRNNWNSSFHAGEFVGLDRAGFRAEGTRPLRFAVIREAGRLDCAGQGGGQRATGTCRFTADARFAEDMVRLGVGRPTADHASALMALGARRDTVAAIVAARYPIPSIDELISLTALGVDPEYISGLARAGYRPKDIDTLIQFKALGITPEWIRGFAASGYSTLPAGELVQFKALGITPAFIAGFERIGYGRLSAGSLVQLKALGVSPEWAQAMYRRHGHRPTVDQLVQMKALGFED